METKSPTIGRPGDRAAHVKLPSPTTRPLSLHTPNLPPPPSAAGDAPAAQEGATGVSLSRVPPGTSCCSSAFSEHLCTIAGNVFREPSIRQITGGQLPFVGKETGKKRRSSAILRTTTGAARRAHGPRGGNRHRRNICSQRRGAAGDALGVYSTSDEWSCPFPEQLQRGLLPGRQGSDSRRQQDPALAPYDATLYQRQLAPCACAGRSCQRLFDRMLQICFCPFPGRYLP